VVGAVVEEEEEEEEIPSLALTTRMKTTGPAGTDNCYLTNGYWKYYRNGPGRYLSSFLRRLSFPFFLFAVVGGR
jgi:hypothetical protein